MESLHSCAWVLLAERAPTIDVGFRIYEINRTPRAGSSERWMKSLVGKPGNVWP
jgi:hypothetical protein